VLEERLGNRPAAAEVAVNLGASLLSLGDTDGALDSYERAHSLSLALGDLALEQRALGGLGVTHAALGHSTEALDNLNRALQLAQRSNDLPREAQWLASLAQTMWTFGQEDEAIQSALDSLEISRRTEDLDLQAAMFTLLGRIYAASKQATRARENFGRALHLYRRLDQPGEVVALLSALANLAIDSGQPEQAEALYAEAIGIATEHNDHGQVAKIHGKLGRLAQRRGEITAGLDHFRRAVEHAGQAGRPALLSKAVQHYATALHAANDPEAIEAYQIAIDQTHELNDVSGEALMRLNLGTLVASQGHLDEGLGYLYAASNLVQNVDENGTALRQHIGSAIASIEAQQYPAEPAPRPRSSGNRGRFSFRRHDERRGRSFGRHHTQAVPEPGAEYDEYEYGPAPDAEFVPEHLLGDGEDRLYNESTLPPE
jgi:tetratricopeptide (TPR) repeat protein